MGPAGGASEAQPRSGEMDASGPVRSDPALPVFLSGAARERDAARVRLVDWVGRFTAPHVTYSSRFRSRSIAPLVHPGRPAPDPTASKLAVAETLRCCTVHSAVQWAW